jgi:hypothetical protein
MARPPRVPVDLAASTRDVKTRVERVLADLDEVTRQQDAIFQDPRMVWLNLTLSVHNLEAALSVMRKAWWPAFLVVVMLGLMVSTTSATMPHGRNPTHHEAPHTTTKTP